MVLSKDHAEVCAHLLEDTVADLDTTLCRIKELISLANFTTPDLNLSVSLGLTLAADELSELAQAVPEPLF